MPGRRSKSLNGSRFSEFMSSGERLRLLPIVFSKSQLKNLNPVVVASSRSRPAHQFFHGQSQLPPQ